MTQLNGWGGSEQMGWSVVKYVEILSRMGTRCTGVQDHIEEELRRLFPPAATETIAEPCLVVDSEGMILLWFLPGLVKSERQVSKV
jgi:hypothetical protein